MSHCVSLGFLARAYQRVMTTLLHVKDRTASEPRPCIVPKNSSFCPANGE